MAKGINPATGMSHRFIDRTGTRNGRLLFTKYLGVNSNRHSVWEAICDCGEKTTTTTPKKTKSCGCLQAEAAAASAKRRALPPQEALSRHNARRNAVRLERKTNPVKAMHARLSRLHRHALAQVGAIKTSPTFEALGYTADEFRYHIEKQFLKGMGWENMDEWQIDHIIPISTAVSEKDVVALNQLHNLRPLWSKDNNIKKDSIETLL